MGIRQLNIVAMKISRVLRVKFEFNGMIIIWSKFQVYMSLLFLLFIVKNLEIEAFVYGTSKVEKKYASLLKPIGTFIGSIQTL